MKRGLKWIAFALSGVLCLALIYLGSAFVLSRIPVNATFRATQSGVRIAVVDNGVHSDLILPVRAEGIDWREAFPPSAYPGLNFHTMLIDYVSIGWGHREFYLTTPTWRDLTPATAVEALAGVGGAVLHVTYWSRVGQHENIAWVTIPPGSYRALTAFIAASLKHDAVGQSLAVPGASYRRNDAFFEANGEYGPITTCNEWTSQALAAAGIRTGLWTPFPGAILDQLRAIQR